MLSLGLFRGGAPRALPGAEVSQALRAVRGRGPGSPHPGRKHLLHLRLQQGACPQGAWGRWPSCLQRVYFRALQGVGRSRSFPCSPRSSSVPPSLSTSDRARCPRFLDLVGILHRGARPSHPRLRLLIITHRSAAQTPGRLAVACLIRTPLNSPFAAGRLRCNTFNLISVVLDVRTVSLSCYFNEAA